MTLDGDFVILVSSMECYTPELKTFCFILLASNDGKELLKHIIFYTE